MLANWNKLTGEKQKFVISMALIILVIYALITYFSASTMYSNNVRSEANHAARMNPTAAEPGKTPPDPLPAGGNFTTVSVGTYIDDIDNLSIRDSFWSTNFYIWFSWKGDKNIDPGSKLLLVDGMINK